MDLSRIGTRPAEMNNKRSRDAFCGTDDYEEMCCLGEGAFGRVTKARHRVTGETVAIKRITDPYSGGPEEELLREACLHEACGGNPFVVDVHGLVRDPATKELCLVMECVGGPSIDKFLRGKRCRGGLPLPEATLRTIMWQLLTGVGKMHEDGVIHRDIKPDNILISDDGRAVKICDFGIAMSMSEPSTDDENAASGTLWYMAPEVAMERPGCCGAPVDSWSLGCVMAELINGQVLFDEGRDAEGQARAIFDVVGYPDDSTWPGFSSTPFAVEMMPILDDVHYDNHLRKLFPEAVLSQKGFEVLNGLLTCNPDKRLTAAAALKHPWFAKVDGMELLKNEEVESAVPKKQLLVAPAVCRCV